MRNVLILLAIALSSIIGFGQTANEGSLMAMRSDGTVSGAFPLKNTSVDAAVSGSLVRVNVRQEFTNSFNEPIESVYTFPLSQNGAVDDMKMTVGGRVIRGQIMKREEARKVYEEAKSQGKRAGLLDQQRPNIFTQAVANIMPGDSIIIEISYVETLKYEDGQYEFVFPMTVGPRYSPAGTTDASLLTPAAITTRPGHDISINVSLNTGVPVESIRSTSHEIEQLNFSPTQAKVSLTGGVVIPNKDFILRYDVSGTRIEDGLLTHRAERGGFFSLILQPPDMPRSEDRTPKEIVFVLDTSGSMYGFPLEKAKEAMQMSLDGLYPEDTFNLITFAGDTRILFDAPVPATQGNLERAKEFLASRSGGGGTEMMKAIRASLEPTASQEHLRIVCFMTDGYVGNEDQIIAEIQKHSKARVYSFGIGNSVNRHLLDKMSKAGRGEVQYVSLSDDGSAAAKRFYERVRSPLLTDISIDWNGLPVADVYPGKPTDLFGYSPVIINGRYTAGASGTIRLKGKLAGQDYVREIKIDLPETETDNDVLATLWARKRIDQLSMEALNDKNAAAINKQIEGLGLEFRLMTQFTSFVAVEEQIANPGGAPTRVAVPAAIPDGVDIEKSVGTVSEVVAVSGGGGGGGRTLQSQTGTVGTTIQSSQISGLPLQSRDSLALVTMVPGAASSGPGTGSGTGTGRGSGMGSGSGSAPPPPAKMISAGVLNGKAASLPKPQYPAAARAVKADGAVTVQVVTDASGKVVSAKAVSGHPLLRAAAEKAALGASFSPTMLSGQPVAVSGVITYNFSDPAKTARTEVGKIGIEPELSPEQQRQMLLKDKLHSWVYQLYMRLGTNSTPSANEGSFVSDGRASLIVVIDKRTEAVLKQLAAAGFVVDAGAKGTRLSGTFTIDKIAALAEIDGVKLILPGNK